MSVIRHDVELGDKVSGPAKSAAAAVGAMSREMTVLTKSLASSQDAMTKAAATGNVAGFRKAQKDVTSLTAALRPLQAEHAASSAAAELAAKKQAVLAHLTQQQSLVSKALTADAGKAAGAVQQLGSAADSTGASSAGLQAELAELTGGLSILVEVAGAVALGFAALILAGAGMAIKANEAKAKIVGLFDALGEGKISGKATVAMLDELGDHIGQTREQLAPLAKGFLTMGITGVQQLRALTLAAASAGALAEGGAESFEKFFGIVNAAAETGSKLTIPFKKLEKQLASVGLNIGDMAKQMGMSEAAFTKSLKAGTIDAKAFGDALTQAATNKGAGPLAKAGAQLGAIWAKAQQSVAQFFEDVDVGPFLAELKSMFDILGQANPSGQALKAGIGGFFKEVFASATKVVPYVKHFLLDLVILGLKAYLAVKPIVKSFNEWRNSAEGMKTISTVLQVIVVVLITVAAILGVVIGAILAMMAVMVGIGVVIMAFVAALIAIPQMAGAALVDFFKSAPQMALDFVMGLVKGISGGASAVVGAVKGLADGAKNAFKSALGIASPSKEMKQMGLHMGSGLEGGLDAAGPGVANASGSMAGAAMGGAKDGASGSAPSSGGGVNVTFATGSIVINGAGKSAEEISDESMSLAWERLALQSGL